MALSAHRLLNRLFPQPLKKLGRKCALAMIPSMRHLDMDLRLKNLAAIGFKPNAIFDIGAAYGAWAQEAAALWPHAKIIGFEPNAREIPALEHTKKLLPQFDYIRGFLGPIAGTAKYSDERTQTSLLDAEGAARGTQEAPIYVLDELLASGRVPQPQMLKLDVQGFELEVLKGATKLLQGAEIVLLEVSLASFFPGLPRVDEVSAFMKERGFIWYDIVGALRRSNDDRLMQIDVIFIREGHALIRNDGWTA